MGRMKQKKVKAEKSICSMCSRSVGRDALGFFRYGGEEDGRFQRSACLSHPGMIEEAGTARGALVFVRNTYGDQRDGKYRTYSPDQQAQNNPNDSGTSKIERTARLHTFIEKLTRPPVKPEPREPKESKRSKKTGRAARRKFKALAREKNLTPR